MGILALLLSLYRSTSPPATQEVVRPFPCLLDLPSEMLLHIASFLPVGSAALLALCNHSTSCILGPQYWEKLQTVPPREREEFLLTLERDLPAFIFCHRCAKLHLPDDRGTGAVVRFPHERKDERPCFRADLRTGTYRYFHHAFRFEHVQMIMKRHRLGLDNNAHLQRLSMTETFYRPTHNYQVSMEVRVESDELLVRAQHRLLIPTGHPIQMPKVGFAHLCRHLQSPIRKDYLWKLLHCRMDHLNNEEHPCSRCTGLKQCRSCPTEFQIDVKDFQSQGIAIVITRWLDLGRGESPVDPKWGSHLWYSGKGLSPYEGRFEFAAGSLRSAFERQEQFSFDSVMTSDSTRKLLQR